MVSVFEFMVGMGQMTDRRTDRRTVCNAPCGLLGEGRITNYPLTNVPSK